MREFPPERVKDAWWYVVPIVTVDGERRPDIPQGIGFTMAQTPSNPDVAIVKTVEPITGARTFPISALLKAEDEFGRLPRLRLGGK